MLKNCVAFTDYINEVNNTEVDNAKCIDIVMSMYNLTEYRYTSCQWWWWYCWF